MTRKVGNILVQIAQRAASHPSMEAAVIGAVRATLPIVLEAVMREIHPGDTLRLYVPKTSSADRQARDQRIGAALANGDAPEVIANREKITTRHVRNIRKRIRGTLLP